MNWILLLLAGALLAYANGANDNIKGAATLFGSRTASYRRTLVLATVAMKQESLQNGLRTRRFFVNVLKLPVHWQLLELDVRMEKHGIREVKERPRKWLA